MKSSVVEPSRVSVEDAFWKGLQEIIAKRRDEPLSDRQFANLSSANCRSDKGSSRRLAMISCKPFQNASSTLTLEGSTTDDFMARLPRRRGGNLRLHWRLNCDVGT